MMHFGVFVAVCAITLGPATIPVFSAQGGPVGIPGGAGRGYGPAAVRPVAERNPAAQRLAARSGAAQVSNAATRST